MRYRKILCERVFTISTSDESESIYEEKRKRKAETIEFLARKIRKAP